MNFITDKIRYILLLLCVAVPVFCQAQQRQFTLVIDAGHGGHDAGAVGSFSKEKNINLNVALAFGRLVESNCPDVKVIYTRRTDVFIPLQQRADIANRNKADLFISVHTNALPAGRIAYGSETYSLGMARAGSNLEVAKRENSVIMLENDYKTRYEGFDPNKAESYVIFEIMQDRYMKQSVELARCIQKQYAQAGRQDKGVHQAGFLVLRNTSMPAVLTELGFISTPAEEQYLNSKQGIAELSRSIYNGFLSYRRAHDKSAHALPANLPSHVSAEETSTPGVASASQSTEVAVVPVPVVTSAELKASASARKDSSRLVAQQRDTTPSPSVTASAGKASAPKPAARDTQSKKETPRAGKPKASTASSKDNQSKTASSAAKAKEKPAASREKTTSAKDKGQATSSKASATKDKGTTSKERASASKDKASASKDKATTSKDKAGAQKAASSKVVYKIQVGAGKREIEPTDPQFKGLSVKRVKEGTMFKYFYGSYSTHAAAQSALKTVKAKISGAYIVAYVSGKPVSVAEAKAAESARK